MPDSTPTAGTAPPRPLTETDLAGLLNVAEWVRAVLANWAEGKSSDAWVREQAPRLAHALGVEMNVLQHIGVRVWTAEEAPPLPEPSPFRLRATMRVLPEEEVPRG